MFNLAQPHLKPIHCSEKFLNIFLCAKPDNSSLCEFSENSDVQENAITIKCGSGEFVSTAFICDGYQDCIDRTDELNCHCTNYKGQIILDSKFCSTNCTININCKCSNLYQNFILIGCRSYKRSYLLVKKIKRNEIQSSSSSMHCGSWNNTAAFIDDLIFDCPAGKDEPQILETAVNTIETCMQRGMFECYVGHRQCY